MSEALREALEELRKLAKEEEEDDEECYCSYCFIDRSL